jgi:hypothetical protein
MLQAKETDASRSEIGYGIGCYRSESIMNRVAMLCAIAVTVIVATDCHRTSRPTYVPASLSKARRDSSAEDAVFARFISLRTQSKLPIYKRGNGVSFAEVACQQANENDRRELSYRFSNRAVFSYTTSDPGQSETLNYVATRPWSHVRYFTVGVCRTESQRELYWVVLGLTGNEWDKFSADMLGNNPNN